MRDLVTEMKPWKGDIGGFMPVAFLLRPVTLNSGFLSFYLTRSISSPKDSRRKGELKIF